MLITKHGLVEASISTYVVHDGDLELAENIGIGRAQNHLLQVHNRLQKSKLRRKLNDPPRSSVFVGAKI